MRIFCRYLSVVALLLCLLTSSNAQIFSDGFTDTTGTPLLSHTADVGGGYSQGYFGGNAATNVTIQPGGELTRTANTNSNLINYRITTNPLSTGDYTVQATFKVKTITNTHPAITSHLQTNNTGYQLIYDGAGLVVQALGTNGLPTNITPGGLTRFASSSITAGTEASVALKVVGNPAVITVSLRGTDLATFTDSTYNYTSTPGTAGIHFDSGTDTTSTGYAIKAFQVYGSSAPVATGFSLTGPTSGYQNVLNDTPFSVSLTPSGGSSTTRTFSLTDTAGGVFYTVPPDNQTVPTVITSVTMSTGTPGASFLLRRTTAATGTINVTDTSGTPLTAPTGISYPTVADDATTQRFTFMGDSNSFRGQNGGVLEDQFALYLSWYGITNGVPRKVFTVDQGYSGQFSSTFTPAMQLGTVKQIATLHGSNKILYQIGTNDSGGGVTDTQFYNQVKLTLDDLKAAGYTVILNTVGWRTDNTAYTDLIALYKAKLPQLVTDEASPNIILGDLSWFDMSKNNLAYFADSKHFLAAGYTSWASLLAMRVYNAYINPPTGGGTTTIIRSNGIHAGTRL